MVRAAQEVDVPVELVGANETLTLHRLGLYGVLGRSLKTTNCLESINGESSAMVA